MTNRSNEKYSFFVFSPCFSQFNIDDYNGQVICTMMHDGVDLYSKGKPMRFSSAILANILHNPVCNPIAYGIQYAYGSNQPIQVAGMFTAEVSVGESVLSGVEFVVIKNEGHALLGRETVISLGVLKLGAHVNSLEVSTDGAKGEPGQYF